MKTPQKDWPNSNINKLAKGAREYVRSQRGIWRKIPRLALLSDGHAGWNDYLKTMYTEGYLQIGRNSGIVIDLLNGELVDASTIRICRGPSKDKRPRLATDKNIAMAVVLFPDDFSALNVVKSLNVILVRTETTGNPRKKTKKKWGKRMVALESIMKKERTYLPAKE